jgi:outer membrane protein
MPRSKTRRSTLVVLWALYAVFLGTEGLIAASGQTPLPAPVAEEPLPRVPTAKGGFLGFHTAMQIALQGHPLLKKAEQTAQAAGALTDQAKARYYPQLDAYAIQTAGTIRPLSAFNVGGAQNKPTSYVESAGVRADQIIYDFGQTAKRISAERANQDASEKAILANKALVLLRVQQAYLQCLRSKRIVAIAEQTVRERGVIRDQTKLLYEKQLRSKLDLNLITVELRNADVQLIQATNELRAGFAELNNAMGVKGADAYTLEEIPDAPSPSATLESLIQEGLENRPELMGSADRIRAAEANVGASKALNFPTITATGMYGVIHFSDAPLNQYGGAHVGQTNVWWGAAAVVSVPLFTGFLIENRVAESVQQKYKEEQRRIDWVNRVALEVTDAYFALQAAQQQVKVEEQEVEASRNALTLSEERYRLGLSSIVDVTTATTALLSAEVRLSEAHYAVHANGFALAYATGKGYRIS